MLKSSLPTLKHSYQNSQPFKHGHIDKLLRPTICDAILDELKNNLKATFKESDLFKFYQTKDLSNLYVPCGSATTTTTTTTTKKTTLNSDPISNLPDLPNLTSLQAALYSPSWLSFVESACSLQAGTLTGKVDMAVNIHNRGCHLLCHDDVIGTRKVSYIVYFTSRSEDEEWKEEEGGMLEVRRSVKSCRASIVKGEE